MSLPCIHDYHQLHTCAHDLVTVFNMFHCQIPVNAIVDNHSLAIGLVRAH